MCYFDLPVWLVFMMRQFNFVSATDFLSPEHAAVFHHVYSQQTYVFEYVFDNAISLFSLKAMIIEKLSS